MNPHARISSSPVALIRGLARHRGLIYEMTRRDVVGRYKGSAIGLLWSLVNPVLLLTMYTFVFSVVFKARWSSSDNTGQFATVLFVGMIIHGLLSETLVRAPTLIHANINYVKKIVFPLEVLPVVTLGAALFHTGVSLFVLMSALLLLNGAIPWTVAFLPLVLFPLVVLALGLAWLLASIGVFFRDVAQPISLLMTALLFFSPTFYPVSALPPNLQPWLLLNPLTFIIEQARAVCIYGVLPDISGLVIYFAVSLVINLLGYVWFQETRRGFANVL